MTATDGSAFASAGSPQLPDLLDSYAVRPPWMVAGVDYAVGVPSGTALKNPLSITNPNIGVDTARHLIWVNGDNITLSGYDFTGWQVYIQGGHQNTTITNSYFGPGGGVYADPSSVNVTIQYCSFNNLGDGSSSLITLSGTGSKIVQYNWLQNSAQHFLELNNGGAVNYSYNLIENGGQTAGSHLNVIQFQGGALVANYVNPIISYNTILQTPQVAGGEQIQLYNPGVGIVNGVISNNTMIALPDAAGNPSVSYMINASNSLTSGVVKDNYMYDAGGGAYGFFYPGAPVTYSGNVDMANGKIIQGDNSEIAGSIPSGPSGSSVVPVIASFSTDSGTAGDHITNDNTLTLTGTAAANSTVNVYEGSTLLGTAAANASGAWSFATAALTNGTHSFTAKTVSGTTASTALSVTIDTVAPTAPVISNNSVSSTNNVTLNGTAEANSKVTVFDGTTQLGTATANANGAWTYTTAALASGVHSLKATDADAAGNTSGASTTLSVTINTAPTQNPPTQNPSTQNLVTNGSFEAGNFSGWTLGGNYGAISVGLQTYVNGQSQSGQYAAALGSVGSDGILSQNLQTTAGQQYTLSFWLANQSSGPDDFTVKWNGTTLLPLVNASAHGYTQYTFTVAATGSASTLEFDARHDPSHWSLDNISVTATGPQVPLAPTMPVFSTDSGQAGDNITNDNTLTLTGTASANSAVKVFDGANQIGTATANSSGTWTYTLAALADGPHSLTARDSGGTASAALGVTIDTVAPSTPSIVSNTINANQVTLKGTAEANSTVQVFEGSTQLGTATTNNSGAWTFTTATLTTGTHNFTAKAMDVAGNNSGVSAATNVTIGTANQAPGAPTISLFSTDSGTVGDHITNDSTPTLSGTAAANSLVKVYDGANMLGSVTADSSGAWSYTTAALANSTHNITATATNAAGNTSAPSAPLSITIDTTAPTAPAIASFSTDTGTPGDHITTDNTLTLTGAAEANSTVKVYDGANMLGSVAANSSGAWSYTTAALANGGHNLTATATDAAGNTGPASTALAITVTAPPGVPTITSFSPDTGIVGDGITDPAILTLTGTAMANSTVKVYDGATLLGTATANASGGWNFTTVPLPDGVHSLTATSTVLGTTSAASVAMSVTVDTVTPVAPTIASFSTDTGTPGDHITTDNTLTLTGAAEANATVTVFDGAKLLGSAVANGSGVWSYTTAALADGAHSLTAKASDAAANTSTASTALAVTIDKTPPLAPTIASFSNDSGTLGDHVTNDTTLTMTGTAETNSTVKVYDGATLLGSATANGSGAWSFATGTLASGSHSFSATDSDAAGNVSAASGALNVSIEKPPIAISVDNYNGVVSGFGFLKGTADANSVVWLYDGNSGATLGASVANGGSWTLPVTSQSNSVRDFVVKASDQTGNTGSAHFVFGSMGNDTIATNAPTNDLLYGNGGNDTFIFSGNIGKDTVADFNANTDVVQLNHNTFADFAAVLAHAAQAGSDVTITIDPSNSVTLHNTTLSQLTHNNIHIV